MWDMLSNFDVNLVALVQVVKVTDQKGGKEYNILFFKLEVYGYYLMQKKQLKSKWMREVNIISNYFLIGSNHLWTEVKGNLK